MPRKRLCLLLSALLMLWLGSCGSRQSYWDEARSRFQIPSYGLSIPLPADSAWVVAEPSALPPHILFFSAAPELGVGLYLFSFDGCDVARGIGAIPENELVNLITKITRQPPDAGSVKYFSPEIEQCRVLSEEAVRFRAGVEIGGTGVCYRGYLFARRGRLLAFCATEPWACGESLGAFVDTLLNGMECDSPGPV